jgi:hypothetical protein
MESEIKYWREKEAGAKDAKDAFEINGAICELIYIRDFKELQGLEKLRGRYKKLAKQIPMANKIFLATLEKKRTSYKLKAIARLAEKIKE